MRLLMLSWRGPHHPAAGGAEVYTLQVLRELVRRGHSATWFCEQSTGGMLEGIRVVAGGTIPGLYLAGRRFLRRYAQAFDAVVDQINVCGFLTPLGSPLPILALIHQRAADIWRYDRSPLRRYIGPAAEDLLLRPYRRVPFVTVSRTSLADLRTRGWTGSGHVAYNGIAPDRYAPPPKEPVPTLVFLGRLQAPGKRLEDALAVHALVRKTIPEARLWVLGRGTPPARTPAGVTFFRDVDDRRRDELLARAWLLIATSVREGWGRMVLEAAASGTPCAVYGTPGLAEAAAAVEGVVVEPRPEALARVAADHLRAPERLMSLGARAAGMARHFNWRRTGDVWEAALSACTQKNHNPIERPPSAGRRAGNAARRLL